MLFFFLTIKSVYLAARGDTAPDDLPEAPVQPRLQVSRLTEAAILHGAQSATSQEGVLRGLTGSLSVPDLEVGSWWGSLSFTRGLWLPVDTTIPGPASNRGSRASPGVMNKLRPFPHPGLRFPIWEGRVSDWLFFRFSAGSQSMLYDVSVLQL